jgi:putative copper resistance protein D
MTGGFSNVVNLETLRLFFFETQFGAVAFLRLMLLGAAVLVALMPWRNKAWFSAHLHIGALLLINQAWLGHAAEGGAGLLGVLMIVAYCIHVIAAGAWVGGLPPLLFVLDELRGLRHDQTPERTHQVLSRYSVMAIAAVALIAVSGIANAEFHVRGSPDALLHTDYGVVLFTKAILVIAMLALAFLNRYVAMPKLRAVAKERDGQTAKLRASVAMELVLGILVLCAAALLGVTPPPQ